MKKTTCPNCGKTILDCRRYPIEALAEFLHTTAPAACRTAGISGSTEKDVRCHGITRQVADRIAGDLREHVAVIWPETVAHDIEDTTRVCAAEDCDRPVDGHPNRLYCSSSCRRRIQARRHRAAHPDKYAARMREWKERNAEEYRAYNRRYQRRYMRLWRERKRQSEEAA